MLADYHDLDGRIAKFIISENYSSEIIYNIFDLLRRKVWKTNESLLNGGFG